MASRPKRKPARSSKAASGRTAKAAASTPRERIIEALMALLAEKAIDEVSLAEIADGAGVSLAELRDAYSGKLAILADWSKQIDRKVLAAGVASASDSSRDRLFEVMMRRFDAL